MHDLFHTSLHMDVAADPGSRSQTEYFLYL